MQKNFEKSADLKLKGVSSDKSQISFVYYSTKLEASSPYSRTSNEEEDDSKSICPFDYDFPPIETPDYQKQLRVLTVLDENFEIDMVSLYNEFMLPKNRNKRKYFQNNFAQSKKNRVKRKWLEKMNQLKKHIFFFFDFLENHYVLKDEVSKQHLNVIKKSNFFKADKTIFRSSHLPLKTILITCQDQKTDQKTKVKASSFKIVDDQIPIISIIEQNNFTNESLHVIGQQLDRIEEKIVEKIVSVDKPVSVKTEKLLIDLPSQKENVMFKTSQSKTLEIVEKMLSDLKVKIEGTSSSTPATRTISKNEIASDENTNSNIVSFVSAKKIFHDDLPEIKRFVGNPKPMSFTKNWYSKPTPLDMRFEERAFQTQFSVFADKLYEWNIDGLSKQEIINKMGHMSMVGIAYQNNHDLDQPEIVNLLVTGFSGTLHGWWDS